ncbi:MAG: XRE family transcriptional regulator [Burkholderiaceae bacterium]|nr:XRE family transcriptional regulator [Burkholderiaceae bacterium]
MPRTAIVKPAARQSPRVGAALAALRQGRGLSLAELSRLAGVSKSMLSQIERYQANPTVAVVWRLATALGVGVGELLGEERRAAPLLATLPVHATPTLASLDGQCELRILGPIELAGQLEWYALTVQPGGTLASQPHEPGSREHLSVQAGALDVQAGGESARVRRGETARYAVDVAHSIHNPGRTVAQAWLVVLHPG